MGPNRDEMFWIMITDMETCLDNKITLSSKPKKYTEITQSAVGKLNSVGMLQLAVCSIILHFYANWEKLFLNRILVYT